MSCTSLNYHIVFSTKDRRPYLKGDALGRLCEYLGGIARKLDGTLLGAGGQPDHLHLAVVVPASMSVAKFVGQLKAYVSGWVHRELPELKDFTWQDGYAAFSVSLSALPKVRSYIEGQAEHHRKLSFDEELMALLSRHGIEYDAARLNA